MVFLALTPAGLSEALALAEGQHPVWCSSDAISEEEFSSSVAAKLTRFNHSLEPADVADALTTIAEHHPGQRVWVEHAAAL